MMETPENGLITFKEMEVLFGVSRQTIYKKYKPFLTPLPTTDNKVFFNKDSAITLHRKIIEEVSLKRKNKQKGNFGNYKTV